MDVKLFVVHEHNGIECNSEYHLALQAYNSNAEEAGKDGDVA